MTQRMSRPAVVLATAAGLVLAATASTVAQRPPVDHVRGTVTAADAATLTGTAAAPGPDGMLVAQELLIFPEKMRGVGEGHRKWDLTSDSTMTNAAVESMVERVKGRVLTLSYKGGRKQVLVPPGAPIVTIVRASRTMLVPDAKVFVVARKGPGGALQAVRISIGIDGLMPPM